MPHQLLDSFPCTIEIPVLWGDMDALQHVNNTVYFRYIEAGRCSYMELFQDPILADEEPINSILASVQCSFLAPIIYPDTVIVGTRVTKIGNSSIKMEHVVVSVKEKRIMAKSDGVLVILDNQENKSIRVPDQLRATIRNLENNPDL